MRDGVAHEVAQHLREPVGVGVSVPPTAVQLEVALAEQRQIAAHVLEETVEVDRLRLDQLAALGAGERQHVGDEAVELVEAAQQRDGAFVAAQLVGLAVEQLDLGAQHRERRAQLVRGVGDEVALALERPLEPLEHVVERRGQDPHLASRARPVRRATERSPALPRRRRAAIRRSGAAITCRERDPDGHREHERERADEHERAPQARLRLVDRRQRIGEPQRPDARGAGVDRLRRARACVRPRRRTRSTARRSVAATCRPRRELSLAREHLGVVADRAATVDLHGDDQRLGVIALAGDEPPGGALDAPRASRGRRPRSNWRHSAAWVRSWASICARSREPVPLYSARKLAPTAIAVTSAIASASSARSPPSGRSRLATGYAQPVADVAHGLDRIIAAGVAELAPQIADVDLEHLRARDRSRTPTPR